MKTIGEGVKTLMKNLSAKTQWGKRQFWALSESPFIFCIDIKTAGVCLFGKKPLIQNASLAWRRSRHKLSFGKSFADGKPCSKELIGEKDIEELKDDNVMKAFAIKNGMDEDQEKLRTMYKVLNVDVKRLYELYRDAKLNSVSTGKKK